MRAFDLLVWAILQQKRQCEIHNKLIDYVLLGHIHSPYIYIHHIAYESTFVVEIREKLVLGSLFCNSCNAASEGERQS